MPRTGAKMFLMVDWEKPSSFFDRISSIRSHAWKSLDGWNVRRENSAADYGGTITRKTSFVWRPVVLKNHRRCLALGISALGTLWLFLVSVGCSTRDPRLEAILRDAKRKQQASRQNTLGPSTPSSDATVQGTDAAAGRNVSVHLAWADTSDNESNFIIERCDQVASKDTATCTGTWRTIATVSANSTEYIDKTASPNQTYIYRVKALNSQGSSGYTETVITTPGP